MDRALFRERKTELYTTFRFAVMLPNRGGEALRVMSIYNDPFADELWIGRAHIADEKTLAQKLCEETRIEVFMLPRGEGMSRKVTVDFSSLRALPLNLDASADEIALEWVVLQKARCALAVDVETPQAFLCPAITKTTAGAAARETAAMPALTEVTGEEPMVELEVLAHVPASMAKAIREGKLVGLSASGQPVPRCKHEFRDGHCRLCGYPGA